MKIIFLLSAIYLFLGCKGTASKDDLLNCIKAGKKFETCSLTQSYALSCAELSDTSRGNRINLDCIKKHFTPESEKSCEGVIKNKKQEIMKSDEAMRLKKCS